MDEITYDDSFIKTDINDNLNLNKESSKLILSEDDSDDDIYSDIDLDEDLMRMLTQKIILLKEIPFQIFKIL